MRRVKVGLLILALVLAALPGASPAIAAQSYTCMGGEVPAGTYQSLTIAGNCAITTTAVVVLGDLVLKPGSSLNAALPPGGNLTVYGDAVVWKDAIFVLGCAPSVCPAKLTDDKIYGSLRAYDPLALITHGNYFGGHISVQGGGGGKTCEPNARVMAALGLPFPLPAYVNFERSQMDGGASISGLQSCWFGFVGNEVDGTVSIQNNSFFDDDATEVVSNHINGSLVCSGNSPAAQLGDAVLEGGHPNAVTGQAKDECELLVE
jgi:hypothetical protein